MQIKHTKFEQKTFLNFDPQKTIIVVIIVPYRAARRWVAHTAFFAYWRKLSRGSIAFAVPFNIFFLFINSSHSSRSLLFLPYIFNNLRFSGSSTTVSFIYPSRVYACVCECVCVRFNSPVPCVWDAFVCPAASISCVIEYGCRVYVARNSSFFFPLLAQRTYANADRKPVPRAP